MIFCIHICIETQQMMSVSECSVHSPWMISGIMQSTIGRHLEHVWRETRSSLGHDSKQCLLCNSHMAKAQSEYFTNTM